MYEEEKKKIAEYRSSGLTLEQIGRLLPIKQKKYLEIVSEMRKSGELPKQRKFGYEKVAEACREGEVNPYVIAERYGLKVKTVRDYKRICGVVETAKRPKRNYRHCDKTEAIMSAFKEGDYTVAEVAKRFGVSWTYAKKLKRKLEEDKPRQGNFDPDEDFRRALEKTYEKKENE